MTMTLSGWLNLDKPAGLTSYQAVARIKYLTRERHTGHAGTLDPLATGVLPIALGKAARTIEFLHLARKTYRAVIELGIETDTLDAEGQVIFQHDPSGIGRAAVENALAPFIGEKLQVPPMFSALKRGGVPLYELARRGEKVELKPRPVTIYRLDLINYTPPLVTIDVECGSGTYIRSIARDLGQTLRVGAHLKTLRRTCYGPFDINDAISLETLQSAGDVAAALQPAELALDHLPSLTLNEESALKISHGIVSPELSARFTDKLIYRLHRPDGELLAVIDVSAAEHRLKVLGSVVDNRATAPDGEEKPG
jgi:tRNA pseudouridine55 synthase